MKHVLGEDFERCTKLFEGDHPFGEDVRHDDAFDDLRTEMGNFSAGRVDWLKVRELAIAILTKKSKDLMSASYLAVALERLEGYPGLADGIAILHELTQNDWDGLYPRKPKPRANAIDGMVAMLAPYVAEREAESEHHALLTTMRERTVNLQGLLRMNLKEQAPALSSLISALTNRIQETPEPAPEVQETQTTDTVESPESSEAETSDKLPTRATPRSRGQQVALPDQPALAAGAGASEIRDRIRTFITPLRLSNPLNPMPYRMLRSLKWDDLETPPAADSGSGKTKVPAPRSQLRSNLASLFEGGRWQQLLHASEGAFQDGSGTFWLDLQLYTFTSLRNLDPRSAAVVKDEVSRLLDRFPKLPAHTFADGTPFAAAETKNWLETSVRQLDVPVVSSAAGATDDSVLTAEEVQEIGDLLANDKSTEALDKIQQAIQGAATNRSRFRNRLIGAQIFLQANRIPWARTLLEELYRKMGDWQFEQWEPETSVEVYQLLALCYGRALKDVDGDDESLRKALDEVKSRLFRLDLRAAAAVEESLRDEV